MFFPHPRWSQGSDVDVGLQNCVSVKPFHRLLLSLILVLRLTHTMSFLTLSLLWIPKWMSCIQNMMKSSSLSGTRSLNKNNNLLIVQQTHFLLDQNQPPGHALRRDLSKLQRLSSMAMALRILMKRMAMRLTDNQGGYGKGF
jgi:hypothetical protein